MPGLYSHTTRATGTVLTASIYNSDHQNHIDNHIPSMMDDFSATVTEMQAITNPGGVGSEDLATTLAEELRRLRFMLKLMGGGAQWYSHPTSVGKFVDAVGVTGTADAITLTHSGFPAAVTDGIRAMFVPEANNTGPVTVVITDGATPWASKALVDADGNALAADALVDDVPAEIVYSSTLDKVILLGLHGGTAAVSDDTLSLANLGLAVSVAVNAITIAVKTAAGTDPAAGDKVKIGFRNATVTNGQTVVREITAALSMTISSGSTLGFASSQASRIYIGAIDNAGTVELCAWHPLNGINLKTFPESNLQSTTAEGGAGAADSAQVLYSTTARASLPFRILGYFEITTGAIAGEWGTAPTKIQVMGPGVKKTGDVVQTVRTVTGAVASGTAQIPLDNTIPQNTEGTEFMTQAIIPTSELNLLDISVHAASVSVNNSNNIVIAVFQDSILNALVSGKESNGATNAGLQLNLFHTMIAGTTNETTFKTRIGIGAAGTVTFNGVAGGGEFGGTLGSRMSAVEIFV